MLSARPAALLHDGGDFPRTTVSKTPGRTLKGRAGLQENVLQNGSATVNPNEKRAALRTPFHQGSSKIVWQDTHPSSKAATLSITRPLGDKTPKPNRQSLSLFTPGPRNSKPSKPSLHVVQSETDVTSQPQPPSSSRTKARTPRFSKCFETPITKGDHWNVSDISIEESTSSFGEMGQTGPDELDDSEPEYMPPKCIEPLYEPPFELPNYKEVGQLLRTLAYTYPADDSPRVFHFDSEDLLKGCDWSGEQLSRCGPDSDEDEVFGSSKPQPEVGIKPSTLLGPAMKRTASRSSTRMRVPSVRGGNAPTRSARPATSLAVRAPDLKSDSTAPRPGTSMSNARPLVRTSSRSYMRAASTETANHAKDDELAVQFADELHLDDDFRFNL